MKRRFVMTAFGKDRRGFVADVTRLLFENRCNLEDTAMIRLVDEFALILAFTGDAADLETDLLQACRRLEKEKGISAFFRGVQDAESERPVTGALHSLRVEGHDHAGIVYKLTQYLAEKDINIERLASSIRPSPETGADLYAIEILIHVPWSVSESRMDEELHHLGDELRVEITRRAARP